MTSRPNFVATFSAFTLVLGGASAAQAEDTAAFPPAAPEAAAAPAPPAPEATPEIAPTEAVPHQTAPASNAAPAQADGPKIDLGVPPPPGPIVPRDYHFHGGFYLAGDVGPGYQNATFSNGSAPNLSGEGFNLNLSLLAGGAVGRGLALGGGVLVDLAPGAAFERGAATLIDSTIYNVMVGPMLDAYPNPMRGWRVGGSVGLATLGTTSGLSSPAFGPGFAAWVGYTPWVSEHVSMGLALRFVGTVGFGENDIQGSTRSINLMASVVYF